MIDGTDFLVVVFLCPDGHFAVTLSSLSVPLNYKIRTICCMYSRDVFLVRKRILFTQNLCGNTPGKQTQPTIAYISSQYSSCRRRLLGCLPPPTPITGRHRPSTYCSLLTPPTIRPPVPLPWIFGGVWRER